MYVNDCSFDNVQAMNDKSYLIRKSTVWIVNP